MADTDPCHDVAVWMLLHGYVTGHGDTLDDLLTELVAGVAGQQAARIEELEATLREIEWHDPKSPAAAAARIVLDKGADE
jgi:hypothetical protein